MRYCPAVPALPRMAERKCRVGRSHDSCGAYVIANIAAAKRHPAVFDKPVCLDITRHGAAAILSWDQRSC
jgi:cytochrome P450